MKSPFFRPILLGRQHDQEYTVSQPSNGPRKPRFGGAMKAIKIATYFLGGALLILVGSFLAIVGYDIGLQQLNRLLGPTANPGNVNLNLAIASISTIGLNVLAFFISRRKDPPGLWYFLITGVLPGLFLLLGWRVTRSGLALVRHTPLHEAANQGSKDVVESLLLAGKVRVDGKDAEGATPLHLAAGKGHKEIVELLVAHRAQINVKTNKGLMPLHVAVANGQKE